jgi:glycosyltransferase 2 family protein
MKGKLSAIVKTLVSILLFYLLFRKMDLEQFGRTLSRARLGILIGSFAMLWIAHYICVFRWRRLMQPILPAFSQVRLFEIYCIGLFFNLAFPTAVGGDVVKMYYAGKPSRQYARSFAATFLDRDAGMLAMMLLACIGTLLLPVKIPGIPVNLIVWISFAAFIVLNVMIFTPALHRLLTRFLHQVRLSKMAARVDAISSAFQVMGQNPRVLFDAFLISVLNQLLVFAVTWLTAVGLHISVSFLYFLVFVPVITLVTMLPITLSGYGLRELASVSLFGAIGIAPASSLALGLISSITILLSAVPGGIIYIFFRNRTDMQQMAAMEEEF